MVQNLPANAGDSGLIPLKPVGPRARALATREAIPIRSRLAETRQQALPATTSEKPMQQ